jgi:predicted small integral membrane protein
MLITRLAKIVMCLVLGLFCLLVAFDNVLDPKTNYAFVQHVLSMDTTFPENSLRYRAITSPSSGTWLMPPSSWLRALRDCFSLQAL